MPSTLRPFLSKLRSDFLSRFPCGRVSYSQDGEDLIIQRIFSGQKEGFYVDVGAHHPYRFSNTYLLYRNGWRGLNFDPLPGFSRLFTKCRPRDIAIEIGVGDVNTHLTYYQFNEPALNTFSSHEANLKNKPPYELISTTQIQVKPLAELLDCYIPPSQEIDFMTIDAEGLDLQVLMSNNWAKYRPTLLVVEALRSNLSQSSPCKTTSYLSSIGYNLFCKVYNSCFFLLNEHSG